MTKNQKFFADPGEIIEGFKQLQKVLDKVRVPLGGIDSNFEKGLNKLASTNITHLLVQELWWYLNQRAKIVISYFKAGVWGGILKQPVFCNNDILFGNGGYEIAAQRFMNMLKQMELNKWGYIRGILYPLCGYSTHCETYGMKDDAVFLWIKFKDGL